MTEKEEYAIEIFNKAIDKFNASPKEKVNMVNIFIATIKKARKEIDQKGRS